MASRKPRDSMSLDVAELTKKLEDLQTENAALRRRLRTSTSGTSRRRPDTEGALTPAQRETLLVSAKRKLYKQASEKIDEALRAYTASATTKEQFDEVLQTFMVNIQVSFQPSTIPAVKVGTTRKRSQSRTRVKVNV